MGFGTFVPYGVSQSTNETTLLIQADADCRVSVDGGDSSEVLKDRILRLKVGPGDHILEAVSKGAPDAKWRAVISVNSGQQKAILIALESAIRKDMSQEDAKGHSITSDNYECNPDKPGDCYQHLYCRTANDLRQPREGVRRQSLQLLVSHSEWMKDQDSRQRLFAYLIQVALAMEVEETILDKFYGAKKTLFTEQNIFDTYADAATEPNANNKLSHLEDILSRYDDELKKIPKKKSVDVDQALRSALVSHFAELYKEQGKSATNEEIDNAAQSAARSHHWFDIGANK